MERKLAALVLVTGIVVMGVAPFLLTGLLSPATETIIRKITKCRN
jgi:NADH:ubiquinone oxidoreductase subunit 4 (subunit M)